MKNRFFSALRLAFAGACLAFVACTPVNKPATVDPIKVNEFTATPTLVEAGKSVSLKWVVSGPVQDIRLLRGQELLTTSTEKTGEFSVANVPVGETVFSIVVSSTQAGVEISSDVKVRGVTTPTIGTFTVDKSSVATGTSAILSWETAAATKVVVSAGGETLAQFSDADAAKGSLIVRPSATTEYTLTASSEVGSDTEKLTVTVLDIPVITVATAEPARVVAGGLVTLSWKTENTQTLTVKSAGKTIAELTGTDAVEGTRTSEVIADTTFEFIAVGTGGKTTKTVTVGLITSPSIISFQALPGDAVAGSTVVLQWATAGVDTCHLTADDVSIDPSEDGVAVNGSIALTPAATTHYNLSCTGEGGPASADLSVNVYGMPEIVAFASDKSSIFRRRESATLSWVVSNATSISIIDSKGTPVDVGTASPAQGSVVVTPNDTTKYTLTAYGAGGLVTSIPVQIQVQDPPPIIELKLSKNPIEENRSSELSWTILDASSYTLTATGLDGVPHVVDTTTKSFNDLLTLSPTETTVYSISADGVGGRVEQSIQLTVIRAPRFISVTSSKLSITRGKPFTVSWVTSDTNSVTMLNPQFVEGLKNPYTTIEGLPGTTALDPTTGDGPMSTLNFPDNFKFPFYGGSYAQAYVAGDGYVCFDSNECSTTSSTFTNQAMPSSTKPNLLITPFWDDLYTVAAGATGTNSPRSNFLWRMDGTAPNRYVTIEWAHMEFFSSTFRPSNMNFKVVLHEDGNFEIWNAPRINPLPTDSSYGYNNRWGTSASVGYEGPGGAEAWSAQPKDDPNASAWCDTYVAGSSTAPKVDGSCDPFTQVRTKSFPAISSAIVKAETGTAATMSVKLKAFGQLGSVESAPLVITLIDAPVATSLTPSLATVGAGEPVNLSWVAGPNKTALKSIKIVDDANNAVFSLNAAQIAALSALQGTIPVNPTVTTNYKLVVTNTGDDEATVSTKVTVDKPTATFAVDKPTGPSGETFTFSWTSSNAKRLTVIDAQGNNVVATGVTFPLQAPTDTTKMNSGSIALTIAQTSTYTLRVSNGSGDTEIPVTVTISPNLDILSFASDMTRQTATKKVTLSWETFNATDFKIEIIPADTSAPPIPVIALSGAGNYAQRRKGTTQGTIQAYDTLFRLTATQDLGEGQFATMTRDVLVTSVPLATVTSFTATPGSVSWNADPVTVSWVTENAQTVRMYEMAALTDNAANGPEVFAARDQTSGTFTTTLLKSTRYRIILTNALNDETKVELASPVFVQSTGPAAVTLNLAGNPTTVPNGGFVDLSWTASNVEKVYLWRRTPETASGATSGTVSGTGPDSVQVPYQYVPYGFADISSTGTPVTLKSGVTSSATVNYDTGFAIMDLPAGFSPEYYGEIEGRILISADGILQLAPAGTPDTSDRFYCSSTSTTGSCTAFANTITNLDTTSSSPLRALVMPFWANLSAKAGCNGGSSDAANCATGRPPGQIYTQLVGTTPNRAFIVQWNNWDASAVAQSGSYTFQAKIYENGDIEYQYKNMQGADSLWARGGSTSVIVGTERRFQAGTSYRNYYLQLPSLSSTSPTAAAKAFINSGDGWRMYSGAQGMSGSFRSSLSYQATRTYGSTPNASMFRATGFISSGTPPVSSQSVLVTPGVNQIVLTEMMVDPVSGSDEGLQWLEIRNLTNSAITLDGLVLQTSTLNYTFGSAGGSDVLPASGYLIVAQQNATNLPASTSSIAIRRLPNSTTGLMFSQPADSVILRSGQVLIDRVEYDTNAGWKFQQGRSIGFDGGVSTSNSAWSFWNDDSNFWCGGRPAIAWLNSPADPVSTPGAANSPCRYFDMIPYNPTYNLASDPEAFVVPMNGTGDDRSGLDTVDIGFPFTHFGTTYTRMAVNDNGWASFGAPSTSSTYSNAALPSSNTGIDALCVFWDDFYRNNSGSNRSLIRTKTIGTAPNREFIVMWDGYTYSSTTAPGEFSFMAVVKETGEIEYHYAIMNQAGTATTYKGSSATVGIEGMQDGYGVTPVLNSALLPSPNQFALKFMKAD